MPGSRKSRNRTLCPLGNPHIALDAALQIGELVVRFLAQLRRHGTLPVSGKRFPPVHDAAHSGNPCKGFGIAGACGEFIQRQEGGHIGHGLAPFGVGTPYPAPCFKTSILREVGTIPTLIWAE